MSRMSRHAGRVVRAVGITTLVGCLGGVAIGIALAVVILRKLSGQYERQEEASSRRNGRRVLAQGIARHRLA